MEFEWDVAKAAQNLRKHEVGFGEAATVFGDALSVMFADPDHSLVEKRYISIGATSKGRLVIVSPTNRGERIRIISARLLTKKERRAFEEHQD